MGNLSNCTTSSETASQHSFPNYNILFVGVSGVGKSSLIDQLTTSTFSLHTAPTTTCQYIPYICPLKNNSQVKLTLIDAPGLSHSLCCLTPSLLQKIDAIVYCYSVVSSQSVKHMLKFQKAVDNIMQSTPVQRKPLVYVIGNKTDLATNPPVPQMVNLVQPQRHFFTSCQLGFNLPKVFSQIAQDIFDCQHQLCFKKKDPLNLKQLYSHIEQSTNHCF